MKIVFVYTVLFSVTDQEISSKYKFFFLQIKKDYLEEGAMADTADLVVLGAYYGTGNKGN